MIEVKIKIEAEVKIENREQRTDKRQPIMNSPYITVLKADTLNVLRDKSLVLMLFIPFIFIPLIRVGGKILLGYFPELVEYIPMTAILIASVVAIFPAFVMGFVMMDEKDGGLNQVLRVLPFDLNKLIGLRVLSMLGIGLFNSILFLSFNGFVFLGVYKTLVLSINASLFAPISAFLMLCISANKIEAAAVLKGISAVTFVGFLQFFIPNGYKYFLAPIPSFWAFRSFEVIANEWLFAIFSAGGIIVQLIYIGLLWRIFLRRW